MVILASWFLTLLAVARVTRFVVDDGLLDPVRARIEARYGEDGFLPRLISCPFCTSIWLGLPAAFLWYYAGTDAWYLILTSWLTFSYVASLIMVRLDPAYRED